jgi:hypothetical protein
MSRLPSAIDAKRATRTAQPVVESPFVDSPMFEDKASPFSASRADPTPPTAARPAHAPAPAPGQLHDARAVPRSLDKPLDVAADATRKRTDDSALTDAIERALDEADGPPSPK